MSTDTMLRAQLENQRAAFVRGAPDYHQRMRALETLRAAVHARETELLKAVDEDFGGRPHEETRLLELFPLYDEIRHARGHLKKWMRRRRVPSVWFLQPSRAFVQYQPLGVVGVIGAWNYQLLLTLSPLVDALAAGNHVMVKPSEITPRSAEVLADIIGNAFPPEYVTVVTGGPDVGAAFAALPFDHLFFTGSTRVGQLVMQAAATNLTPVTLELGGKSPALIHDSFPMRTAAARIMTGKLYNAGQTCVAPDYVLLPAGREAEFEAEVRRAVAQLFPQPRADRDYTRIVSRRHFERLTGVLQDAAAKGARVVTLAEMQPAGDGDKLMAPVLVFNPSAEMTVMQEEIFGPILPVVTYAALADAISFINARPRPLSFYYFDHDQQRVDHVLASTMSGGVTVNDTIFHLGQHNLPFGGVGASGMGHYHGFDGFATMSKKRAVMVQSRWTPIAWFRPPYAAKQKLIDTILKIAMR